MWSDRSILTSRICCIIFPLYGHASFRRLHHGCDWLHSLYFGVVQGSEVSTVLKFAEGLVGLFTYRMRTFRIRWDWPWGFIKDFSQNISLIRHTVDLRNSSGILRFWLEFWWFISVTILRIALETDITCPDGQTSNLQVNYDVVTLPGQLDWVLEYLVDNCFCQVLVTETSGSCNDLPVKFNWLRGMSQNTLYLFWFKLGTQCYWQHFARNELHYWIM